MTGIVWRMLAAMILAGMASPAAALCVYKGELYARTTVAQEFADARWVVRARVLSAQSDLSGDVAPWTMYRLEVVQAFKGAPARELTMFTWRNSGGFYLDRGAAGPDIGGEYLLFLNPLQAAPDQPPAARGATAANYSCGRSGLWREVSRAEQMRLRSLSDASR